MTKASGDTMNREDRRDYIANVLAAFILATFASLLLGVHWSYVTAVLLGFFFCFVVSELDEWFIWKERHDSLSKKVSDFHTSQMLILAKYKERESRILKLEDAFRLLDDATKYLSDNTGKAINQLAKAALRDAKETP